MSLRAKGAETEAVTLQHCISQLVAHAHRLGRAPLFAPNTTRAADAPRNPLAVLGKATSAHRQIRGPSAA